MAELIGQVSQTKPGLVRAGNMNTFYPSGKYIRISNIGSTNFLIAGSQGDLVCVSLYAYAITNVSNLTNARSLNMYYDETNHMIYIKGKDVFYEYTLFCLAQNVDVSIVREMPSGLTQLL